jgi:HAD superfamily hydrolase (TIGR01509 family)
MASTAERMVIFDCDGVLVDSERLAVEVDVEVIGSLGWSISTDEVIDRFLGRSYADALDDISAHIGRPLPLGFKEWWVNEYNRVFDERLEAVPGVVAAVSAIQQHGFETCVASSGSHERILRSLQKTKLWDLFSGRTFSALEVPRGKPAPDLFLFAASKIGIEPSSCIVVEDSQYGVMAAHEAGMRVVGFAGGITPSGHLREADAVIEDMKDLSAVATRLMPSVSK